MAPANQRSGACGSPEAPAVEAREAARRCITGGITMISKNARYSAHISPPEAP